MAESIVERVRKAISTDQMRATLAASGLEYEPGQDAFLEKFARIAVEAMREPTESMQVAGGLKAEAIMFEGDKDGTGVVFTDMGHVYRAMIRAALQEKA